MGKSLRMTATAIGIIAGVLLVVFWIRSLFTEDRVTGYVSGFGGFRIYSSRGCLVCCANTAAGAVQGYPWGVELGSDYWLDANDDRIVSIPNFDTAAGFTWLSLPYWFLFILAAIWAIFTWRNHQFSLRTLLLAMTLVAVLMGIMAGMR